MSAQQTKTGRNLRWYANGSAVGMTRMQSLKPDKQTKLETVVEVGNPDVVEYAKGIPETTLTLDYTVISYDQLAKALGQAAGSLNSNGGTGGNGVGEVPDLPDNFDIVERLIKPGTEGTAAEVYQGFVIYGQVQVDKEAFDNEVNKFVAVNLTAKCRAPRRYVGINGIQFDNLTGNGVLTNFVLTQKIPRTGKDGYYTIRVEAPTGTVLKETVDFTVASSSSTTTLQFTTAPASSATPNILAIYPY